LKKEYIAIFNFLLLKKDKQLQPFSHSVRPFSKLGPLS